MNKKWRNHNSKPLKVSPWLTSARLAERGSEQMHATKVIWCHQRFILLQKVFVLEKKKNILAEIDQQ
jgi:hypothetical protein